MELVPISLLFRRSRSTTLQKNWAILTKSNYVKCTGSLLECFPKLLPSSLSQALPFIDNIRH
jgi:hypothetical protein